MDKKIVKFILYFYIVVLSANVIKEIIIPYNRTVAEGVWQAIIILFFIIYFGSAIFKTMKIKELANLSREESKFLSKSIKNSGAYKFYMRRVVGFIFIWILISVICIFIFTTVLEDWKNTGWEWVKVLATMFVILGMFLLVIAIIPDLKNSFPDIRKIFENYGLETIETEDSIHYYECKLPSPSAGYEIVWLRETFNGYLTYGSFLEYKIEFNLKGENTRTYNKNIQTCINIIGIDIKIDMKEALLKEHKIEINLKLKKFLESQSFISFKNINFEDGIFIIKLQKEFYMDSRIICEYMIGILKSCYEIEKAFISLA